MWSKLFVLVGKPVKSEKHGTEQKKLCSLVKYSLCLDDKFSKKCHLIGFGLVPQKDQINTDVTVEPKGFVEMFLCQLLLLLLFVND